jgi:hypothetical protein
VLLPYQRISGYSEQRVEIVAAKWPKLKQLATQNRLKIGGRHIFTAYAIEGA